MSPLYIALFPLVIFVIYQKVGQVIPVIKNGHRDELRGQLFFLFLEIVVVLGLVFLIESS